MNVSLRLSVDTMKKAIEMVSPLFPSIQTCAHCNTDHVHIVMINLNLDVNKNEKFSDAVFLYEHSIGDKANWPKPFDRIALQIAETVWTNYFPNSYIDEEFERVIDPKWKFESAWMIEQELLVVVAGIRSHYCRFIATSVISACTCLHTDQIHRKEAEDSTHNCRG